jgi:hypothetical protein
VKSIQCEKNIQNKKLKESKLFPLKEERNTVSLLNTESVGNGLESREKDLNQLKEEDRLNKNDNYNSNSNSNSNKNNNNNDSKNSDSNNNNSINNNNNMSLPPHWRSVQPVKPNRDKRHNNNRSDDENSVSNEYTVQYASNIAHDLIASSGSKIDEVIGSNFNNKIDGKNDCTSFDDNNNHKNNNNNNNNNHNNICNY